MKAFRYHIFTGKKKKPKNQKQTKTKQTSFRAKLTETTAGNYRLQFVEVLKHVSRLVVV